MKKNDIPLQKAKELIKRNGLYRENEKTLVGFSGGADSVTLLHILSFLLSKERIAAVHVNHMLRGASADADEEFCRSFCKKKGIPFYAVKIDILSLCGGKSFEETARNERYRIFEETAVALGCTTVSLAHTASDNLETMIFHLCRGAGASGLSGIPVSRSLGNVTVVRPLLDVTREEILAYIEENNLSFQTDETNGDTAYTRNFIRAEIIPKMKQINARTEENARFTASAVADLYALAESEAKNFLQKNEGGNVTAESLAALPHAVRYPVLEKLYQRAGGASLPRAQAESLSLLIDEKKTGASLSLSGKITARIDGKHLRFSDKAKNTDFPHSEIPLHQGENILTPAISVWIGEKPAQSPLHFYAETAIPEESLSSLFARPRKAGESYRFGGMTRKLKKLLCGADLAAKTRPVICDANGILWLPGFPVADKKNKAKQTIPVYYIEK